MLTSSAWPIEESGVMRERGYLQVRKKEEGVRKSSLARKREEDEIWKRPRRDL